MSIVGGLSNLYVCPVHSPNLVSGSSFPASSSMMFVHNDSTDKRVSIYSAKANYPTDIGTMTAMAFWVVGVRWTPPFSLQVGRTRGYATSYPNTLDSTGQYYHSHYSNPIPLTNVTTTRFVPDVYYGVGMIRPASNPPTKEEFFKRWVYWDDTYNLPRATHRNRWSGLQSTIIFEFGTGISDVQPIILNPGQLFELELRWQGGTTAQQNVGYGNFIIGISGI